MPKYCLKLEFNGLPFCGWQLQDALYEKQDKPSVQGVLEKALSTVLRQDSRIVVQGCGRTDAGVHAHEFFCTFEVDEKIEDPFRLNHSINSIMPNDICSLDLKEVDKEFHVLNSVKLKTYEYKILCRRAKPVLTKNKVWWIPIDPELVPESFAYSLLLSSAKQLEGEHDFASFAARGHNVKTTVRTILSCDVKREFLENDSQKGTLLTLTFKGKGFLRHQVRHMVGSLVKVASGKRPESYIQDLFALADGPDTLVQGVYCAPAYGLYLKKVDYE